MISQKVYVFLWLLCASAPALVFGQGVETRYTYDNLGRLMEVKYGSDTVVHYNYDLGGNRLSVQVLNGGENPLPVLSSLSPSGVVAGSSPFTLTIIGNNFTAQSVVQWNGADRPTTFVDSTQLTAAIPATDIAAAGSSNVTVTNGSSTGGTSNPLVFLINNSTGPAVSFITINPSRLAGGGASAGTVTLSQSAPSGGVSVTLTSSDTAATVPANVSVPEGTTSAIFSINTSVVSNATSVVISGSYAGSTRTATLVVTRSDSGEGEVITMFVPIVLSAAGLNNSFYTSELALTNRGTSVTSLDFTYTSAFGDGSGTASDTLSAGKQRIFPDAIIYLKSIGIPIPDSGNRGGTLAIRFSGLTSPSEAGVTVRLTTAVEQGRAGLAFTGVPVSSGLNGTAYLCGLRQNASDRSNVAIQNLGQPSNGDITLRLTVYSGDPAASFSKTLPDETLSPGGFRQISEILTSNGISLTNGYVRIERVSGAAPFYAYGVINDQNNSDGSFVPPILETAQAGRTGLTIPVIVETTAFSSELVLTNWSAAMKKIKFDYVATAIQAPQSTASFSITLQPGEQSILPNFVQALRNQAISGIGPAGPAYVGALFATVEGDDISGLFVGARTSTPGGGGRYGLFYAGVPYGAASATTAWLYGLQQNPETRSNLALVNTGETDGSPDLFTIELFNGDTGSKVRTVEGILLNARGWTQVGGILAKYAAATTQGYAKITRASGNNPFITYGVINDGGQPGQRTGDGAFVPSSP